MRLVPVSFITEINGLVASSNEANAPLLDIKLSYTLPILFNIIFFVIKRLLLLLEARKITACFNVKAESCNCYFADFFLFVCGRAAREC